MAKATTITRSLNAGEFSPLMAGRTDLERYPSSATSVMNFVAAPQGPAIARSGTQFMAQAYRQDEASVLLPFVFSNEQSQVLEVTRTRIRFHSEDGLQVYAGVQFSLLSIEGQPLRIDATGLDALVGDEVVLSGIPSRYRASGAALRVTAKTGNIYTLSDTTPPLPFTTGTASRVYHVDCKFTKPQLDTLRVVGSIDVLYLVTRFRRPSKLQRYGAYDWRLQDVTLADGPYAPINDTPTTLRIAATGNGIPNMTSDTTPSGEAYARSRRPQINGNGPNPAYFLERQIPYKLQETASWYAFTENQELYYAPDEAQTMQLTYRSAAAFVADGYVIHPAKANQDTNYGWKDYAPSEFTFEGSNNGTVWTELDRQIDYVLYDGGRSSFFPLENVTAYTHYRLTVFKTTRNGQIEPRIERLMVRDSARSDIVITASSVVGVNRDRGFLTTDVGRLLRIKGTDNAWRELEITARVSATEVRAKLKGSPFPRVTQTRQWRLGYWSDTTGWPGCGDFAEDRLWLAGSDEYPDVFAASVTGEYENFKQTDDFNEVLDTSAIVARLNIRNLSRILWLSADDKSIVMGTGSEERKVSGENDTLTARNIKARPASRRGSADVEPVRIDLQALYVQRGAREVREFSYVFESDGYKSPSMSQLASHIGAVPFVKLDYAATPHSIVWALRADGSIVGLTYNRDENVVGWHRHDLAGAVVESATVVPQRDGLQDSLWLAVKRRIGDQDVRYIERLTRFWDFDMTLDDAHFVDSGLRYRGDPVTTLDGVWHLEGQEVYGLADGIPFGPVTVTQGSIPVAYAASNIVVGLGFDAEIVLPRADAGGEDGTSQGKTKRVNKLVVSVWDSYGGQIGLWNEQRQEIVYDDLRPPYEDFSQVERIELQTCVCQPITPSLGYDLEGIVAFRRPKEFPVPMNVVSVVTQLITQDR